MPTSWNDTSEIEKYLGKHRSNGDALLFEARLILEPDLTEKMQWQHKSYSLIKTYGRQQLKQQIEAGAPADIFAAAAQADMDALVTKKLVTAETKVNFAKNGLVVAQNINSKVKLKSVADLSKTEVKKIAVGTSETVPAGRYAKESLTELKVYDSLKEKMVFGENVRQVLDYVSKNEVDAGIVYSTDALSDKSVRTAFEIPESSHKPIVYPIAVVKATKNEKIAKDFITFVTSKSSQAVFKKYGFR